jgi:WhiB family transcriptional regulator, redox-sensing transcriptional regulator
MLDLAVFGDLPWMHDALCAERHYNPDLWFPSHGQRTTQAKAVCEQCAVQHECLTYALSEDIRDGV